MASQIIRLDAFRRAGSARVATRERGILSAKRGRISTARQRECCTAADVTQIPTEANKRQRCQAAAAFHRAECCRIMGFAQERVHSDPVTGAVVVTSTDLKGGDFNLLFAGIYKDDPSATLRTLQCLAKFFADEERDARNALAVSRALPRKAPICEVAL